MSGRWRWRIGPALTASIVCSTGLAAQASWTNACSVLTSEEFQRAYGINPQIGIMPDDPTQTEMGVGPHCDISRGSITLFTKQSPSAGLDGMLKAAKADKRVPVQGLGDKAFFTIIYPDDKTPARTLAMINNLSVQQNASYYREHLAAAGWKPADTHTCLYGAASCVMSFERGNRKMMLALTADATHSEIVINLVGED